MVHLSVVPWDRIRAVHQLPRVNCLYFNSFWLVNEILVSQMNWSAGGWPVFPKLAEKGLRGITRTQRSLWNIEKGNTGWKLFHPSWQGSEPAKCWIGNRLAKPHFFRGGMYPARALPHRHFSEPTLRSKDAVYVGEGILTEGKVSAAVE